MSSVATNEGDQQLLSIWTLYERPRDYPEGYIARRFEVRPGSSVATDDIRTAPTLDALRKALPKGLYCIQRNPEDDPVIVETWL